MNQSLQQALTQMMAGDSPAAELVSAQAKQARQLRRIQAEQRRSFIDLVGIDPGAVGGEEIAPGAVSGVHISVDSITATHIVAGTITAEKIAAGTITAVQIAAGTITAGLIAAGTIIAANIAAGTITADLIASATITGDKLVSGAVTADKISVASLSAVSANLGSITAGTITGGTFRTSSINPRVQLDSTGLTAFLADGTISAKIDAGTGKVITLAGIGGSNERINSSFENQVDLGDAFGCTLASVTAPVWHGQRSLRVTAQGGLFWAWRGEEPCTPGEDYVFSAYVRSESQPREAFLQIGWTDSAGARIRNDYSSVVTSTTEWRRVVVRTTAPSNAVSVSFTHLHMDAPAGEVHYVDGTQKERGALTTAYAPKPDEILPSVITRTELAPGSVAGGATAGAELIAGTIIGTDLVVDAITAREIAAASITAVKIAAAAVEAGAIAAGAVTAVKVAAGAITADKISLTLGGANLLAARNTGFEENVDGWTTSDGWAINGGATLLREGEGYSWFGTSSMRVTVPGVNAFEGAALVFTGHTFRAGRTYTLSAYVSAPWFAYNLLVGQPNNTTGNATSVNMPMQQAWHRVSVKWTPVADTSTVHIAIRSTSPSTNHIYIDGVQLEEGELPTAYSTFGPGMIASTQISPGAITANRIAADAIDGKTITGATIRTAATGARVQLDGGGLRKIDSGGATEIAITPTGGLTITPGGANYLTTRAVRWVTGNGNTITEVSGRVDAAYTATRFLGRQHDSSATIDVVLQCLSSTDGTLSQIHLNNIEVRARAGIYNPRVITNTGASDFQQVSSDSTLKKNIKPLSGALERLHRLRGTSFEWRTGKGPVGAQVGVIAQEIQPVFPEAVQTDGETLGVLHASLIALLIESVKELSTRVDALSPRGGA